MLLFLIIIYLGINEANIRKIRNKAIFIITFISVFKIKFETQKCVWNLNQVKKEEEKKNLRRIISI